MLDTLTRQHTCKNVLNGINRCGLQQLTLAMQVAYTVGDHQHTHSTFRLKAAGYRTAKCKTHRAAIGAGCYCNEAHVSNIPHTVAADLNTLLISMRACVVTQAQVTRLNTLRAAKVHNQVQLYV